jgi:hypothetical protein
LGKWNGAVSAEPGSALSLINQLRSLAGARLPSSLASRWTAGPLSSSSSSLKPVGVKVEEIAESGDETFARGL